MCCRRIRRRAPCPVVIRTQIAGCFGGFAKNPDDLIEHVPGELVEDAAPMGVDLLTAVRGNVGRHVGADGKDVAEQAALGPFGDQVKTVVVTQHVAHLNEQLLLAGGGNDALPLRPVVSGSLVVPYVLACRHDLLGLVEALYVEPLGRHGDDSRDRRASPAPTRTSAPSRKQESEPASCARCSASGSKTPTSSTSGFSCMASYFACGVRVLCSVLGHLDRHGNSL